MRVEVGGCVKDGDVGKGCRGGCVGGGVRFGEGRGVGRGFGSGVGSGAGRGVLEGVFSARPQARLQQECDAVRKQRIPLHLTQPDAAANLPPVHRLPSELVHWTSRADLGGGGGVTGRVGRFESCVWVGRDPFGGGVITFG